MFISGKVIKGQQIGTKLGYPTANLDRRSFSRRKLKVRLGVYAGMAEFTLQAIAIQLPAAIVIGPMDKEGLPKIEAHLLGFTGNLYGKKIKLELRRYLRGFHKYNDEKSLIAQIERDVKKVKQIIKQQEIL